MPSVKACLTKMRCLTETNEVGADEPYVLVFAAKIESVHGLVNVPSAHTVKYEPWTDVDKQELVQTSFKIGGKKILVPENFWGFNGKPQQLNDLNEVIFLAALMENDDADTPGIRTGLHAQMFASITSYANAGMSRSDIVRKLKKDMRDVLKGVMVTGLPNNDDLVSVDEIKFPKDALVRVQKETVVHNMELAGDGGRYRLRFELNRD